MKLLENLLRNVCAAPKELVLMSRWNCHAKNVSSIVYGRTKQGGLERCFLAWPDHRLYVNAPHSKRFTVGVHDHRYNLALFGIFGLPVNLKFIAGRSESSPVIAVNRFDFQSGVADGRPEMKFVGKAQIYASDVEAVRCRWIKMQHDELHTVHVGEGQAAAWVVCEEERVEKPATTLYTNASIVDVDGLYGTFTSKDHVINHVEEFLHIARRQPGILA